MKRYTVMSEVGPTRYIKDPPGGQGRIYDTTADISKAYIVEAESLTDAIMHLIGRGIRLPFTGFAVQLGEDGLPTRHDNFPWSE